MEIYSLQNLSKTMNNWIQISFSFLFFSLIKITCILELNEKFVYLMYGALTKWNEMKWNRIKMMKKKGLFTILKFMYVIGQILDARIFKEKSIKDNFWEKLDGNF